MNKNTGRNAALIVLLVLLIDQSLKLFVKTHLMEGQEILVMGRWFRLHFVENSGMAFSMELPTEYGKLLLSSFRLVAIGFIIYLLGKLIRERYHPGLVYCGALILAGAIGNMIDSAFYGLIFTDSLGKVATLFPKAGGYAGFLKGNVVDMLWFPIIHGVFPQWMPMWKGEYYEFFRPVFNIADSSITVGVALIILFQKPFFDREIQGTGESAAGLAATEEKPAEAPQAPGAGVSEAGEGLD